MFEYKLTTYHKDDHASIGHSGWKSWSLLEIMIKDIILSNGKYNVDFTIEVRQIFPR